MTLTVLFWLAFLLALLQPNKPRLYAGLVFVGATLLHEALLARADGLAYYGSAALFDLGVILATAWIRPVPPMVLRLHALCLVSIVLNAVGWGLWLGWLEPTLYNWGFVGVYVAALYVLGKRDAGDVGNLAVDSWRACFRFDSGAGYFRALRDKGRI